MPGPTSPRTNRACFAAARSKANRCMNSAGRAGCVERLSASTIRETLMPSTRLPVLEKFIADLRTIWSAEADNRRRMERAKPLLEQLVKDAGLKAHSASCRRLGALRRARRIGEPRAL